MAQAQGTIAEQELGAAFRTYRAQFTDIGYALSLPNASLLVADFGEMTLVRLDGVTGSALPVGRKGSGPKEYQVAGQLLRLRGDTIAMFDAAQARVLLVTSAGEAIRTVTLATDRYVAMRLPQLLAADALGRVYGHAFPRVTQQSHDTIGTSLAVVRMNSFTATKHDTLATLWLEGLRDTRGASTEVGVLKVLRVRVNMTSLQMSDAAMVARNGDLVVLRGDGYRIQWLDSTGSLQREINVEGTRYPLTPSERVDIVNQTRDRTQKGTAHARRLLGPEVEWPRVVVEEPQKWPVQKPYFRQGARLSDNGTVFVPVDCASPAVHCLDVLNADGSRRGRYRLPERARFLTADDRFLFLAQRDEDDLETVIAYRIP